MTTLVKRVVAGMGANAFGISINIGIQLLTLPVYLHYWGVSKYGAWLVISAIPSYFSMTDVGVVTAAGNEMTIALARGEKLSANRIFQSAYAFMLVTCGSVALVTAVVAFSLPAVTSIETGQQLALEALMLTVLLSLFGGLSEAVFKASGRYAFATNVSNIVRLGEWAGSVAGLVLFGTFAAVAFGALLLRSIGLAVSVILSKTGNHGLSWGFEFTSAKEIRRMLKPAFAFMAFPLANAIGFQGMTILVASFLGTGAVAIFNTYRTLARVAVQVTSIFSHALWTEFGRHLGAHGLAALRRIYSRAFGIGLLLAFSLSVCVYLAGPWLLAMWTHRAIKFESTSMLLMLIYAAIASSWHVPRVLLMSTNAHTRLAWWALASSLLSLLFAALLCLKLKVDGAILAMLLSEVILAAACGVLVDAMFRDDKFKCRSPIA